MASIYYLNHPPTFWDQLTTGLEDHPFFAPRGHHHHHAHHHRPHPFWGWDNQTQSNNGSDGAKASQAADQNPASPGPSAPAEARPEAEKETNSSESGSDNDQRRRGQCGKGKHHHNGRGCPHHGLGKGRGGKSKHGSGHHHKGFHGHPFAHFFGGPPPGRGPHRGHHGGPPAPNFDFLRNLAAQFGIHLNEPTQENVDFVPSVDVFDTPTKYIVHVSLAGAKKDDLSIDYDPDESVLRLAGVVYRPGINEDLHQALVMEERAREVGVFEREIRLGTRESPAAVAVDEITAKLEDGVLNVGLPKIVVEPELKKKVVVEDGNAEKEQGAMHVDESASETMTPEGSDSEEGETREYVKVPVE